MTSTSRLDVSVEKNERREIQKYTTITLSKGSNKPLHYTTTMATDVPLFRHCEVLWDHRRMLGEGTFCQVWELKRIALRAWQTTDVETTTPQAHPAMGDNANRQELVNQVQQSITTINDAKQTSLSSNENEKKLVCGRRRWAVKLVRDDLDEDEENLVRRDLQREWRILQNALPSHPNIISLHGIGIPDYDNEVDDIRPTFLILDFIPSTLEREIDKWKVLQQQNQGSSSWTNSLKQIIYGEDPLQLLQRMWMDRLQILRQLAEALAHVHKHGIVYRDLKPSNVGLDRLLVKLFDFGLAKVLPEKGGPTNGSYHLTGQTGTWQYMAPEVGRGQPYGTAVDVYSLAILMQQVLTLEDGPWDDTDEKEFCKAVLEKGWRPHVPESWPTELHSLVTSMWDEIPSQRPAAANVVERLSHLCSEEQRKSEEANESATNSSYLFRWTGAGRNWVGWK